MSAAAAVAGKDDAGQGKSAGGKSAGDKPKKGIGKLKLILIAVPVLLAAIGAGLWFTGVLPRLLGMGHTEEAAAEAKAPPPPVFVELPDIVANLNVGNRRASYVKLKARLELARPEDEAAVKAALPRVLDLFQTYLREMRPEELRGSAGTYRLREELIARTAIATAPVRIRSVLFTELLVQ